MNYSGCVTDGWWYVAVSESLLLPTLLYLLAYSFAGFC